MTDTRTEPEPSAAEIAALPTVAAELIERDAWLDLFAAAPTAVRAALGLCHHRIGGMGLLASSVVPITEFNRAMAVGAQATPPDDLEAAVAWLGSHAAPGWAFQVAPPALAAVRTFLDRHGLQPTGAGWAKFVRALPAKAIRAPATRAIVAQASDRTAGEFGATVQRGFGLPEASAAWFGALVGRPGWHCFLATMDGEPAGAAATFVSNGAAWSGMSATLPDVRGQGVQTSLIAARAHVASEQGATLLTSETGRPSTRDERGFSSYRNQQRAGLREVYVRSNFKRPPQS